MSISGIEWGELDLAIDDRQRADAPEKLKGVLAFGQPVIHDCLALAKATKEKPDPEMKFLSDQNRFTYMRLALTIRPQENLDVRFVSLDVTLEGDALCWSMEPMKVEQELKSKTEAKISSKLKVKLADVGAEVGGEEKDSAEYVIYQPVVEAFNLMRGDPGWELRPTAGRHLSGVQLFHMVVQVPKLAECRGRVSLRADIKRQGFIFNYHARRPDATEDVATLVL
jgi:hypothetical protein